MSLKDIFVRVSIYCWAIYYGLLIGALITFRIVLTKGKILKRKTRSEPAALRDESLGVHHFANLSSSTKIHYVSKGDASKPLVLFLHGFPDCWASWSHQLRGLDSKNFHLVAMSMRGYGLSSKPAGVENYSWQLLAQDVKELVEHLGHRSVSLVAHDWGGIVAWLVAAKYPTIMDKLIIVNSPHPKGFAKLIGSSWSQHFKSWYMFLYQLPWLPELILRLGDFGLLSKAFVGSDGKTVLTKDELEGLKFYFSTDDNAISGPINYYRSFMKVAKLRIEELPHKITCPTYIIWGRKDPYLSESLAEMSVEYVQSQVTVEYIDVGAHFVQLEKPKEVNRLISNFLTS